MMFKKKDVERLKKIAKFLIIFNLLAIPMYIILLLDLSFTQLQTSLTYAVFWTLKLLGFNVRLDTLNISVVPFIIYENHPECQPSLISWDSTGWKSLYTLAALVIATPIVRRREKLIFLAYSLPLLFVINFLRIITTLMLAFSFGCQYFEIVHTFLWREGLIAVVLVMWYLWLKHKL